MASRELSVLGDFRRDATALGPQAANTEWAPTAASGNAELDSDEVAEIRRMEIYSPMNGLTPEALEHVWLVLDDVPIRQYVNICGRNDALMAPPAQYVLNGAPIPFGDGIIDALKAPQPALSSTTLKYKHRVRVVTRAGATPITQDYRIVLWGFRYREDELKRLVNGASMPISVTITDRTRNKTFTCNKGSIPIDRDNWVRLPGGPKQDRPIIMPFWRWAINALATTVNMEYQWRHESGGVAIPEMDMFFDLERYDKAILLKGLGIRAAENLKQTWIAVTGDPLHKEHPKGRFPTTPGVNPLHFGAVQPLLGPEMKPLYFTIPRFADDSLLLYKDLAYVAIQDNGTSVAANSVYAALNGVIFDYTA